MSNLIRTKMSENPGTFLFIATNRIVAFGPIAKKNRAGETIPGEFVGTALTVDTGAGGENIEVTTPLRDVLIQLFIVDGGQHPDDAGRLADAALREYTEED